MKTESGWRVPETGESPYQVLLEQYERWFRAGEENRRVHDQMIRSLVAALVVLLAVGVFRLGGAFTEPSCPDHPGWLARGIPIFLALGLCSLLRSTWYAVGRGSERRSRRLDEFRKKYRIGAASLSLAPEPEDLEALAEPPEGSADRLRLQAALALAAATYELARRNNLRDAAFVLSTRWFLWGVAAVAVSFVLSLAAGWDLFS